MQNLNKELYSAIVDMVRTRGRCFVCFELERFDIDSMSGMVYVADLPDPYMLDDGEEFLQRLLEKEGITSFFSFDPDAGEGQVMLHRADNLSFNDIFWIESKKGAIPTFDKIDRTEMKERVLVPGDYVICIDDHFSVQHADLKYRPIYGNVYVVDKGPDDDSKGLFLEGFDQLVPEGCRVGFWKRRFVAVEDYYRSLPVHAQKAFLKREDIKTLNIQLP